MTDEVILMTQTQAEELAARLKPHLPPGWRLLVEPLHIDDEPEDPSPPWGIDIFCGRDRSHSKEGYGWAVVKADKEVEQVIDFLHRRAAELDHQQTYQPALW